MKTPTPALFSKDGLPPRAWQDLFGLLLTLLALVIVGKLAIPRILPPPTVLAVADCDPQHESCHLVLPNEQWLALRLTGAPVSPTRPFSVEISPDSHIRLLSQEISGIELDMGSPVAGFSQMADGQYRSPANIPLCSSKRMTWRLAVRFEVDGQYLEWPVRFTTETEPPQGLKA